MKRGQASRDQLKADSFEQQTFLKSEKTNARLRPIAEAFSSTFCKLLAEPMIPLLSYENHGSLNVLPMRQELSVMPCQHAIIGAVTPSLWEGLIEIPATIAN